ncbi:MAG: dTDP-4-dehydrorhamnose reductase [Burkholderiaceae bacterium]
MKILLLGCNGQLGWELQRSLGLIGDVVALQRDATRNPDGLCGDLLDLEGLRTTVQQQAPQVIVNAAGYTAVDTAQSQPDAAHTINARAPALLAEQAQLLGAWLVHYSSDYVFDGSGTAPWRETDTPAPLNVYGQTKLAGEEAMRSACAQHLLLRTSWVYAARGSNFAKTMLRLAGQRASFSVVDDQVGAPTAAEMLADATAHMLRAALAQPALAGTYHCTAAGATSWHAYARFVVAQARAMGWPLLATPDGIAPIPSRDYPTPAPRPLNSRLCCDKLTQAFGLRLPPWQWQVLRMLEAIRPQAAMP